MHVYLDDQPLTIARPTFAFALREARRIAESKGRVIVEATLDGLTVPDHALADPPDEEYPQAEVRFSTDDPIDLCRRTLDQVAEALEETKADQTKASDLIQTGRLDDAMHSLSAALTTWGSVQQVVTSSLTLLGMSLDRLEVEGASVAGAVDSLASRLGEVKRSISAQDWSGLSDALAYDMQDQAKEWRKLLQGLSAMIGAAEAAGRAGAGGGSVAGGSGE